MTGIQARALEYQGKTFTVPSAAVGLDRDARLALAIVTEGPVEDGGRKLLLDLSPGAADLGVARNNTCPVLIDHMPYIASMVGGVLGAVVEAGVLKLLVRFAHGGQADDVWRLLAQGFPLAVSLGLSVEHAEEDGDGTIRAVRWRARELSVCVRGKDENAYVRRVEPDEDMAAMVRRMSPDDPDGLGRRVALRRKLHLDDWLRWSNAAGVRLAWRLGVGIAEATDALREEVSAHIGEIEAAAS